MSRPLTLEQALLNDAELILENCSSDYDQRLSILETYAARIAGLDIYEYWKTFGIEPSMNTIVGNAVDKLSEILPTTGIPLSLALSSLAREPIPISEKKHNGVFYTDFRLASFVAEDCSYYLTENSRIADIAAGSGILLAAVAESYYKMFPDKYNQWISSCVYAYDLSSNALRGARIALMIHASSIISVKRMNDNWKTIDSLLMTDEFLPKFDIVIGNPPWGKVKLSLHSFINDGKNEYHIYGSDYGDYDKETFQTKKQIALDYSKLLKERYSLLGNVEPDMYMAFLQKALSILKQGGHLSYLVPAGLIRSFGTEPLRRYLIRCSKKLKYYLLDNKAKFFEIDSRFKFLLVSEDKITTRKPCCDEIYFEICEGDRTGITRTEEICFNIFELEKIRPDLTVPECRDNAEKELFSKIMNVGQKWKDTWSISISREIDMTNDRSLFQKEKSLNNIPVIEGRMVQQFRFGAKAYISGSGRSAKWIANIGEVKAQFYIDEERLNEQLISRINTYRAGYCDIAGQTNERSMMSAVIPPGVICGNKVPTIMFSGKDNMEHLYFFVGVTNSFVFDWMLRRILSTTVNYFLLFSLPMPNVELSSALAKRIIDISKNLSVMGAEYYSDANMGTLRAELDIAVAKAYGINFRELELILKDFLLLDRNQPPLNGEKRSTYTRDLLLSLAEKELGNKERIYITRKREGSKKGARAYIPSEMTKLSKGGKK